jgi:hypothetical protein
MADALAAIRIYIWTSIVIARCTLARHNPGIVICKIIPHGLNGVQAFIEDHLFSIRCWVIHI